MVLKSTKIEGRNLCCFIEDADAKTKTDDLERRSLKLHEYMYANDSAIIMIAKCPGS
jgi:hypothetical protein